MKKEYLKPITYLEKFKATDVITTSATIDDKDPADNDLPWGDKTWEA
ncbi:hypothetical protein [uncultured Eubacterium sp.]|nr:hypothetical protein [uncultured Eubacterium sp.]